MQGHSVFVAAHTSAGNTAVAEYAIALLMSRAPEPSSNPVRAGAQRICGGAYERGQDGGGRVRDRAVRAPLHARGLHLAHQDHLQPEVPRLRRAVRGLCCALLHALLLPVVACLSSAEACWTCCSSLWHTRHMHGMTVPHPDHVLLLVTVRSMVSGTVRGELGCCSWGLTQCIPVSKV